MANDSGGVQVSYNGEIYNYQEIREELRQKGHVFKTNSDTEVLIRSYEEWGIECLHKFIGMFALAIWDERENRLFLARDRVGIKPLYYYGKSGVFDPEEISRWKQIFYDYSSSGARSIWNLLMFQMWHERCY